jgi:hypothetical protein
MSIDSLSSGYLQSILNTAVQNSGLSSNKNSGTTGVDASSLALQPDNTRLSPFAQLMSTLQQLQQSDPTKYQQVTQQISANLQTAAQTAQSNGNTTAAAQLNQLSTDFANASKTGQLPNVQDLAQAVAGGHHHHGHHHSHAASGDSDANSATNSSSSSSTQAQSQLLAAYQKNSQTDALNPMSIILNTLSNAGITSSNS